MSEIDFKEMKEKLAFYCDVETHENFNLHDKENDFKIKEADFTLGARYQHSKDADIIKQLFEIIELQTNFMAEIGVTDEHGEETHLGIYIDHKDCDEIKRILSETTTRLQKLMESK